MTRDLAFPFYTDPLCHNNIILLQCSDVQKAQVGANATN